MSASENAFYAPPKFSMWRWLGFGTCRARIDDEEFPDLAPAYLLTETYAYIDWKDRLRLLVSGRMMVSAATKTDVIVHRSVSTSAVSVLPPGFERPPDAR